MVGGEVVVVGFAHVCLSMRQTRKDALINGSTYLVAAADESGNMRRERIFTSHKRNSRNGTILLFSLRLCVDAVWFFFHLIRCVRGGLTLGQ